MEWFCYSGLLLHLIIVTKLCCIWKREGYLSFFNHGFCFFFSSWFLLLFIWAGSSRPSAYNSLNSNVFKCADFSLSPFKCSDSPLSSFKCSGSSLSSFKCSGQRPTRILDPGNSRENKLHFFSLDHEILFCNSRSPLET